VPDAVSLQGGSPQSLHASRPLSPLDGSVLSFRSGTLTVRSCRSNCTGLHHKTPLMPWYKRDVFASKSAVGRWSWQQQGPCRVTWGGCASAAARHEHDMSTQLYLPALACRN
jgi:hypothetical protein